MGKSKVYFRADGHNKMGIGHVIRSLALAEMLSPAFECHFIIRTPLPSLKAQILAICHAIIELPDTKHHLTEAQNLSSHFTPEDIVVLDGYHFKTDYQTIIKVQGCKLVCIDDIHTNHFVADAIVNHAGGIKQSDYSCEPYSQLFLGFSYALLRKPFRDTTRPTTANPTVPRSVLICLGGADPNNDTLEILKVCAKSPQIKACAVVIGAAFAHLTQLKLFLKETQLEVQLYKNISAQEMANLMLNCPVAVTAPSTVAIEYLSIGGSLYLKKIADNQKHIFDYLIQQKLAKPFLSNSLELPTFKPKELVRQNQYFDGKQQQRFLSIFQGLLLTIRAARLEDMHLYFNWSNDPMTRKQSFNTEPIPWENHQVWFSKKLSNPNALLYVLELANTPVAQVRFDLEANTATISFSIDKDFRGRKLGTLVLQKSIKQLKKAHPQVDSIIGYVKNDNIPSLKTFEYLGFQAKPAPNHLNSTQFTLS